MHFGKASAEQKAKAHAKKDLKGKFKNMFHKGKEEKAVAGGAVAAPAAGAGAVAARGSHSSSSSSSSSSSMSSAH